MYQHTLQSKNAFSECSEADHSLAKTAHFELYADTNYTVVVNAAWISTIQQPEKSEEHAQEVQMYSIYLGEPKLSDQDEE